MQAVELGATPRENASRFRGGSRALLTCGVPKISNQSGKPAAGHPRQAPEPASSFRRQAVEAAKQPSYGKRAQLIPDGHNNHLELAKTLAHPFDSMSSLKEDHAKAISGLRKSPSDLIASRFRTVDMLRQWEAECRSPQMRANKSASWTAAKLGLKPNTVLMEKAQALVGIPDEEVPNLSKG